VEPARAPPEVAGALGYSPSHCKSNALCPMCSLTFRSRLAEIALQSHNVTLLAPKRSKYSYRGNPQLKTASSSPPRTRNDHSLTSDYAVLAIIVAVKAQVASIGVQLGFQSQRLTGAPHMATGERSHCSGPRLTRLGPAPADAGASRLSQGCSHPHRRFPAQAAPSLAALLRQGQRWTVSHLHSDRQRLTAHVDRG
jgi:hypothetical protein